jgi:F-type H+-transporting ATPase subunit delta
MVPGKLTKRYTRALFELANEESSAERVARDLEKLAAAVNEAAELRAALESPSIAIADKRAVLDNLLKKNLAHRLSRNFAMLLLEKGRMNLVGPVARAFVELLDAAAGRVRAEVVSAAPLQPNDLSRLRDSLVAALRAKDVSIDARVDPSLIGGVVTRVGNVVLDGSLRYRLEAMREHLMNR